jgi:hypothetical protein
MAESKQQRQLRGRIIASLRKLTYSWTPRNEVRKRARVAPGVYQCESCAKLCYEGKSEKNFNKYKEQFKDRELVQEVPEVDHIETVFPLVSGWVFSYDEYIARLFVEEDKMQLLCKACHKEKTKGEEEIRRELRKETINSKG